MLGYVFGHYKPSERAIPIRADDIFVVSFFKSGNTWTRFLLANLLNPERPVTFENIERTSPDIYQFQYQDYWKLPSPLSHCRDLFPVDARFGGMRGVGRWKGSSCSCREDFFGWTADFLGSRGRDLQLRCESLAS